MDDLCLYSLMSDQYTYNTTINCLMGSLIYFTARCDATVLQHIYSTFKLIVDKKDTEVQSLGLHRDFALLKLKELGAKEEEMSMIRTRMDITLCW